MLRHSALGTLLAGTGVLYLWGLSASGWANAFYSAAAQAGSRSWTAWFFGSSDAANAITVDKTPAALWVTGLSVQMLQAYLVLPALAAAWLLAAPVGLGRRLRGLAAAAATLLVSSGWWVLAVELWPADRRPYVGGSQTNSVVELVLGYNGFGRLTGDEVGSVGGGPSGAGARRA